ncbi:hypothetical protein [Pontibacter liquoris]|uniref:hypothetical protein n=1 Tax=Pontibacter liquoris TaxID=2905677 RepID=UPI001FA74FA0|nr:hypothetical protein [Pontibacter liquoris]
MSIFISNGVSPVERKPAQQGWHHAPTPGPASFLTTGGFEVPPAPLGERRPARQARGSNPVRPYKDALCRGPAQRGSSPGSGGILPASLGSGHTRLRGLFPIPAGKAPGAAATLSFK